MENKPISLSNFLKRVDIDKLASQMHNPEEAHTDYDKIACVVCSDFCRKHCPEKHQINAGVVNVEIFCQDIYNALIEWRVLNDRNRTLDEVLENFKCKHNVERLVCQK